MAAAVTDPASQPKPFVLRWQGLLQPQAPVLLRLQQLATVLLLVLLGGLPLLSRTGLALVMLSSGLTWLLWSLCTPPDKISGPSTWLLIFLGVALLATGFSPVPIAAAKGLLKLLSYLKC